MITAIVADLHFQGQKLQDKKQAWEQAVSEIIKRKVDRVELAGDIFHKPQIGGREASTGTVYRAFMDGVKRLIDNGIKVVAVQGNHDMATGDQLSALEPLKDAGIEVIDEFGHWYESDDLVVCYIPWVSSSETRERELTAWLKEIKSIFKANKKKFKIVTGHIMVRGAVLNSGICLRDGSFEVSPEQLDDLGADVIAFGDIHKRQPYYVGALSQNNFGEEGNPQGFMLIDSEELTQEFVGIDAPQYFTFNWDEKYEVREQDYVKYRFAKKPDNYDELISNPRVTVEIIPDREVLTRKVEGVEAGRSDEELLDSYLKGKGAGDADRARIVSRAKELAGGLR